MSSPIFGHLESSLADHLTEVTHRVRRGDDRTVAALAREELPRLVRALQAVLAEHTPDRTGRCPNCRASRFGPTPTPCRAYLSAHLCLVATDEDPPAAPTRAESRAEVTAPLRRPVVLAEPRRRGAVGASG